MLEIVETMHIYFGIPDFRLLLGRLLIDVYFFGYVLFILAGLPHHMKNVNVFD